MQTAEVTTIDGSQIKGLYLMWTDTTIVVKVVDNLDAYKQKYGSDVINLNASQVMLLKIDGEKYQLYEGCFLTTDDIKMKQRQKQEELKRQIEEANKNNVHYAIGKALKNTGTVSLSIGVPCFVAGIACVSAQHIMQKDEKGRLSLEQIGNVAEAGYYLLPIGASLTIVGIPLYIHGKNIMQMEIKYTGTGAGIAQNF